MERSKKVKPRVSWAEGSELCKVKLFQKEDSPFKVGPPPQPHIFSENSSEDPDLPPGFENYRPVKPNVSTIPQIKWKRPQLKFSFDDAWQIKNGEESTERQTEEVRTSKVLEAFYPYLSVIPSSPAVSMEVEAEHFDDSKTPVIPTTEDNSESEEESSHSVVEPDLCALQKPVSGIALDFSKIDTDLLVKILTDPEMVKNLLTKDLSASLPSSSSVGVAKEQHLSARLPSSSLSDVTGRDKAVAVQPKMTKSDVHNLIRKYGKEHHQTNQIRINGQKVRKQCRYFGTVRGCRNNDGCRFLHDRLRPNTEDEAPRTKRLKFGR